MPKYFPLLLPFYLLLEPMKNSYHTDIAIQYKLGILNNDYRKHIPSSTLHNWKNKDFSSLVGAEYSIGFEQNIEMIKDFLSKKYLLRAAKAIYFIYTAYVAIFSSVKNSNKLVRQSKDVIVPVIDRIKESIGLKRALRAFGISYQQYYSWQKKVTCHISPISLCRKKYYNQLTEKETGVIKDYLKNPSYAHWSITSVYYMILRDKAAFFSRSTFYKYTHILKLTRSKPEKKKYRQGIRADSPCQILHADVTIYKAKDNVKLYIYLLIDNFSRFILNWKVSTRYSAKITFENIKEAYEYYSLHKIKPIVSLITDGGSENKGEVEHFVKRADINMEKIVAQRDIIFSNSMVEAANKRLKYDYLFPKNLSYHTQVGAYLDISIPEYNQKPHSSLFGLVPQEVFNGMLPDKDMFKPAIKSAILKRKTLNLKTESCKNCF